MKEIESMDEIFERDAAVIWTETTGFESEKELKK